MMHKNKSPCARVGAARASKENAQCDFTEISFDKSPPLHISAYVKNVLVQLDSNESWPHQICVNLINVLSLRGE